MMQTYLRRACCDRRRLLLAVSLNLSAGHFGFGRLPDPIPEWPRKGWWIWPSSA